MANVATGAAWDWNSYPPGCPVPREFSCRPVDVGTDPAQFWRSIATSAPDWQKKVMLTVPRIEIPQDIQRATNTPELKAAAENTAARHSMMSFQCYIESFRNRQATANKVVLGFEMKYVGLSMAGRTALYDLIYFAHTDSIYARNCANDSVVYQLS